LGLGLHPFYALVTDTTGNQYRTQTAWVRFTFKVSLLSSPLRLSWPTTPGLRYNVLAATNLTSAFQTVTSTVATSTLTQWPIPAPAGAASFYRVTQSQ